MNINKIKIKQRKILILQPHKNVKNVNSATFSYYKSRSSWQPSSWWSMERTDYAAGKGFPNKGDMFWNWKKTLNIHSESTEIFFIILDILCHLLFKQCIGQMSPETLLANPNAFKPIFDDFVEHFWWYGCYSDSDIGFKLSNCLWFIGINLRFNVSPKEIIQRR